jgi:glycosyltransferase involved in cell wall biosynthesis
MSRLLSVVVPCFNEEDVIEETWRRLSSELEGQAAAHALHYEIIFVNDGSRDATLGMLHQFHSKHADAFPSGLGMVRVVSLARNFGHQIALTAGLTFARGDATVAIDADLQDPPAVIGDMILRWNEGVDVAYGLRRSREGETWFKLATARAFYIVVRHLTRIDIPLDTGDFRLMSRRAVDAFNAMPERHRFIRGMIPWLGFRQEAVLYDRAKRFAGSTKYPFSKMVKLAVDGITSFSNAPLQTAYYAGFVIAAMSFVLALYIIARQLITGFPVPGWASLMVAILFLGSVQLVCAGILGEYVGRIYDEVKQRPLFLVDHEASRGAQA